MTKAVDGYFFMLACKNITAMLRKQEIGKTSVSIRGTRILYKQQDKSHLKPGTIVFPFWYLGNSDLNQVSNLLTNFRCLQLCGFGFSGIPMFYSSGELKALFLLI